ncbi:MULTISPECIES: helix-turn-helix transcriptional regulator [Staphylococcus]|uniref:Transcriptional regulator n=1 Tax=Staphylococcus cohnii TaxID=29382 RepID=A0A2T4LUM7_9STAP|nr:MULTISPECIES: helix-turn-helix transcriptional regulator [Staphylococcus]PTF67064.1 transcriptional regulator [Staphylococcus cohnii]RIL80239.1 XRE family transcriptional regulator [Staphylococcus cohnii]RIM29391.1 XRE family transcriptional regulator [Staphylococcus cohnii]RIM48602.1 XRE family transcriptional regulator [Staphylococcus cohnii]
MNNKLEEIRKSKGISITQLSVKSGISRTTIYKLEDQKTNPSLETISKIASGLNEKPEKIFNFNVIQELQI